MTTEPSPSNTESRQGRLLARRCWRFTWLISVAVGVCALVGAFAQQAAMTQVLYARLVPQGVVGLGDPVWAGVQPTPIRLEFNRPDLAPGSIDATVRALHTTETVYLLVQWNDPSGTQSIGRDLWHFARPGGPPLQWSQEGGEDQLAVIMPMTPTQGFDDRGCAAVCHTATPGGAEPTMRPAPGERFDVWRWAALRTNPAQAADDGWLGDPVAPGAVGPTLAHDQGIPAHIPNRAQGGASPRWGFNGRRSYDGSGYYLFSEDAVEIGDAALGMSTYAGRCARCHGAKGEGGQASALAGLFQRSRSGDISRYLMSAEAQHTQYVADPQNQGVMAGIFAYLQALTPIPGHIVGLPTGSCRDVAATARFGAAGGAGWSVLLARALNTGNADDVTLRPGDAQPMAFAVMDGSSAAHYVSGPVSLLLE